MADEQEVRRINEARVEERSASKAAYEAAMAYGAVTSGTGALAGGLAAAKMAFGKKTQPKKDAADRAES
jgi:L-aminopeptidase/D-esterase-like protein